MVVRDESVTPYWQYYLNSPISLVNDNYINSFEDVGPGNVTITVNTPRYMNSTNFMFAFGLTTPMQNCNLVFCKTPIPVKEIWQTFTLIDLCYLNAISLA